MITENKEIVAKYKKEIESIVPSLCDAIDDADYEKAHKIIDSVLNVTPIDQPNLNYCKSSSTWNG